MDDLRATIVTLLKHKCLSESNGIFTIERSAYGDPRRYHGFTLVDRQYPFGHHLSLLTIETDGAYLRAIRYLNQPGSKAEKCQCFDLARPGSMEMFEIFLAELLFDYCQHLRVIARDEGRHRLMCLIDDYESKLNVPTSRTVTAPARATAPTWDGATNHTGGCLVGSTSQGGRCQESVPVLGL
jgi:hypothetical protein